MAGEDVCDAELPLPKGWIKAISKKFDKPYFYHENTKCSIWVHPALLQKDGEKKGMCIKAGGSKKDQCSSSSSSSTPMTINEKSASTSKSMMELLGLSSKDHVRKKGRRSPQPDSRNEGKVRERSPIEQYEERRSSPSERSIEPNSRKDKFDMVPTREDNVNYNVLTNYSSKPKLKPLAPLPPCSSSQKPNRKRRSSECASNGHLESQPKVTKAEGSDEDVEEHKEKCDDKGGGLTPAMKAIIAKRKSKAGVGQGENEKNQPDSPVEAGEGCSSTANAAVNLTPAMRNIIERREGKNENRGASSLKEGSGHGVCNTVPSPKLKKDKKSKKDSPPPPPPPSGSATVMGSILDRCSSFIASLNPLRSKTRSVSHHFDENPPGKSEDLKSLKPLKSHRSDKSSTGRKEKAYKKLGFEKKVANSSLSGKILKGKVRNTTQKATVPLKPLKPLNLLKPQIGNERDTTGFDNCSSRYLPVPQTLNTANTVPMQNKPQHPSDLEFDDVEDMEVDPFTVQINRDIRELRDHQTFDKPVIAAASTNTTEGASRVPVYHDLLYIVLDTNVLLSDLQFVTELKDNSFPVIGAPILMIPWIVFQELDSLKDATKRRHTKSDDVGTESSENLSMLARKAIGFIGKCLDSQHPRVKGQSAIETGTPVPGFTEQSNDDSIIHCALCLKLQSSQSNVVILSNDRNLCNKSIVFGVQAFGQGSIIAGLTKMYESNVKGPGDTDQGIDLLEKQIDEMSCELQCILRDTFSKIIESEMISAYGDDLWLEIVKIKPPWTLADVFILLEEHWIAVFGHIIGRHNNKNVKSLNEICLQAKTCVPSGENLKSMLELSMTIMKGCQANPLYNNQVRESNTTISQLIKRCDDFVKQQVEVQKEQISCVGTTCTSRPLADPHHEPLTSYEKVRLTFDNVWSTANRYSALVFASLKFPNPLVKDLDPNQQLPSTEESMRCLSVMIPCIYTLKQCIHDLLYSEPHPDRQLVINLFQAICNFSREVTKHECAIYLDDLAEFCQDSVTKEFFIQGLGQLDRLYATLQQCADYFK